MYDVIIIGSGPAGVSAAVYAARAGLDTAVISQDSSALEKAERIENYYGFAEPVSGEKLFSAGIAQAKRLGANIITDQVVGLSYEDGFVVKTKAGEYTAKSVVIATGANRTAPRIKGFADFEGKGISYCAACDAFFYKGKDVAVLGCCEYALHEAQALLPIARTVTLVTNGAEAIAEFPAQIKIITEKIAVFEGNEGLERIRFSDDTTLPVDGVFVAIGVAGSSDLARKIGAETEGLRIKVDENMSTNIPGLFAAGDCTGGMLQIVKAAYEGAKAGTEAVKFVRKNKS
ncbi:MAG: NAD(P)/FAD-dependent oxidoreductase [Burkholderiales bacterium]